MNDAKKLRIEFGDFQTPRSLASNVCQKLKNLGVVPKYVIEPTCGVGAFLLAASDVFQGVSSYLGFEKNQEYLTKLKQEILKEGKKIDIKNVDFFEHDWAAELKTLNEPILVLGNFPWVTNSGQGAIGGANLPLKSNFLKQGGFDAISGKSNFDISEWMLLEVLKWFKNRSGTVAMLLKTAVARKMLAHVERQSLPLTQAFLFLIDAKKEFGASVDACLLVMKLDFRASHFEYDYVVHESIESQKFRRVGHRNGHTVSDMELYEKNQFLSGRSPQRWRSGVKHDCSSIMEFSREGEILVNGLGDRVKIEDDYLYPLLKGSDIGGGKGWGKKYILVTQRKVGECTDPIKLLAPLTWKYLERFAQQFDARGSTIYLKNPRFSVFGVGDYTFMPWKIAICGLYKRLKFRLVGPIEGKPVIFDDTVYSVSFASEAHAKTAYAMLTSKDATDYLSSLIFWDEKRPIKAGTLNTLDWTKLQIKPQG